MYIVHRVNQIICIEKDSLLVTLCIFQNPLGSDPVNQIICIKNARRISLNLCQCADIFSIHNSQWQAKLNSSLSVDLVNQIICTVLVFR